MQGRQREGRVGAAQTAEQVAPEGAALDRLVEIDVGRGDDADGAGAGWLGLVQLAGAPLPNVMRYTLPPKSAVYPYMTWPVLSRTRVTSAIMPRVPPVSKDLTMAPVSASSTYTKCPLEVEVQF